MRAASGGPRPPGRRRHRRGARGVRAAHRVRRADPGGLRGRAAELGLRLLHRPCEGGYTAMAATLSRIFDERPGTTGFVVQNESAVEPLLALLRQQGRAVPEDVSVVAVCPEQVATEASVRLTAVAVPAHEMGRRAVECLVAGLQGRGAEEVVLLAPS
ncbi:substrate-binding domain-containing protein [Streptomyces sp. M19]